MIDIPSMDYAEETKRILNKLGNYELIVMSDGEPYIHTRTWEGILCKTTAGGLTTALNPVMQTCGGVWVARGSGDADRAAVNENNEVMVPPDNPKYTLRRVFLNKEEIDGYFNGFSNQMWWPLCHNVFVKPRFNPIFYTLYKRVNEKFAESAISELSDKKPLVWIQDFHLTLVPGMIRKESDEALLAYFWHIPWPAHTVFRIVPWRREIMESMLENTLIGFHTSQDCRNFLLTAENEIEGAKIDWNRMTVTRDGRITFVRPFPISVDYKGIEALKTSATVKREEEVIEKRFDCPIGVGVDRIDYIKGLPEKFSAIDRFLFKYPEYQGKFTFVQTVILERPRVPEFLELDRRLDSLVDDLNWRYSTETWKPVEYMKEKMEFTRIVAMYKKAKVCIVSSLNDGLNIVCKEFISSQDVSDPGVLILSEFAGAAEELGDDALLINPYDIESFSDTIKQALEMPLEERKKRMERLQKKVGENDIYKWTSNIFKGMSEVIPIAKAMRDRRLYRMGGRD